MSNDSVYPNLEEILKQRTRSILERFGEVAVSEVEEPYLREMLEAVKDYWNDTFRPALVSYSCEAAGGNPEQAMDAGLMLTLASSGFGVHDDILDRSLHKHFRRTILGLYGIDGALLVGDLLIAKGWTVIHEIARKTENPRMIADIVKTYGKLSIEVCEAELMETLCRKKLDTNLEYYQNILWKAMAEMEACTRIGALIGNGQAVDVEAIGEFGRGLGFISRLGDDLEDCLNNKGALLPRIENESLPLPLLYAANSSKQTYAKIEKIIEKQTITPKDSKTLLEYCFETEAFDYVQKLAKKKEGEASRKLCILKPSVARDILSLMIHRSYTRVVNFCI
ncbi:MAG TPA: polyprenyl synthetase family protein [Candidatus Nanoarchaeia archaeon]|nr:polyprenyl synthetase family protein [Candidatus Nanoarchaeia archaeon]